jgi:SAM-dependent methyltransferase
MTATPWDDRYAGADYIYGTEPNEFLCHYAGLIPEGPVLCLAEGEGRNAVHLAGLGHKVTAIDQSAVGMDKAQRLAAGRGVAIETVTADLAHYEIEPGAWTGIVGIFCHLPPALRARVMVQVVAGLRPGGVFLLEGYTPEQLQYRTGGPSKPEMLMTAAALKRELAGLRFERAEELVRPVREGSKHTGDAAVVQIVAVRD